MQFREMAEVGQAKSGQPTMIRVIKLRAKVLLKVICCRNVNLAKLRTPSLPIFSFGQQTTSEQDLQ